MLYASDYCHWDCHFPYSVKDIVDGKDLSFAQKEKLLGKNAVAFFELKNLAGSQRAEIARHSWENGKAKSSQRRRERENELRIRF